MDEVLQFHPDETELLSVRGQPLPLRPTAARDERLGLARTQDHLSDMLDSQ